MKDYLLQLCHSGFIVASGAQKLLWKAATTGVLLTDMLEFRKHVEDLYSLVLSGCKAFEQAAKSSPPTSST